MATAQKSVHNKITAFHVQYKIVIIPATILFVDFSITTIDSFSSTYEDQASDRKEFNSW